MSRVTKEITDEVPADLKPAEHMIKVFDSGIHGKGVLARQRIPKGTYIIQYKGELISKDEAEKRGAEHETQGMVCVFELNDKNDIDGSVNGNDARYINHSCDPNCEAISVEDKEIWIAAIRDIEPGEELTYDYGYDDEEVTCRCGSAKCRGRMSTTKKH